jgi:quinol monooxygenase YgiN
MIFIVVQYDVIPEHAATWLDELADFTAAVRDEPGNRWFEWSRSADDPNRFVLLEAFDDDAGEAHMANPHIPAALALMQRTLARTPRIISQTVQQDGWDLMAELRID